jgi:hypothetical protein
MLWYNILNPRNWPGVNIKTGNNKVDGVYYNLLSSNHVSLAASGSMFLAANSGIKLISPSFVDTSGLRASIVLAENFGRIDNSGNQLPLYSGSTSGLMVRKDDSTLVSTSYFSSLGDGSLAFTSGESGKLLYTIPAYVNLGNLIPSTNKIGTFSHISFKPQSTNANGSVAEPPSIATDIPLFAEPGIVLGPNSDLDSYKGFILTHAGSGNVAQWAPATYIRENYDTEADFEGLEDVGLSWIRFPRRPIVFLENNKIGFYISDRPWSPYPPVANVNQIIKEFGEGFDTLRLQTMGGNGQDVQHTFTKFATTDISAFQESVPTGLIIGPYNLESLFETETYFDPMDVDDEGQPQEATILTIHVCPSDDGFWQTINQAIENGDPTNGLSNSVTKGGYLPMQLSPDATDVMGCPEDTLITFKPSTCNNLSIRPNIHTAFNMLGENIDFLVYGKKTLPFNNYSNIYNLNNNYIPQGLVPALKIDANIENSVIGSPSGVIFSTYLDRAKTIPSGWSFEDKAKVCINTSGSYVLASIPSGTSILSTYADLTVSGHTYSTSLTTEDIYLRPTPIKDNSGKYISNALLTLDSNGKIVSRTPRVNPTVPSRPLNVRGTIGHYSLGAGHYEYSIQWDPPANDGNSTIIKYHIQFSLDGGSTWTNAQTTSATSVAYIDRGIQTQLSSTIKSISSNVIFRVAAQNRVGIGSYSEATSLFIANTTVPTAPISLSGTREIIDSNISELKLSWSSSAQLGFGGEAMFSGYVIEESEDNGNTWYYYNMPSGNSFITETEEVITGLSSTVDYLYRISAWNSSGQSAYSFIYSSGIRIVEIDPEEAEVVIETEEETQEEIDDREDVLGNWDFGVILFTGVCSI